MPEDFEGWSIICLCEKEMAYVLLRIFMLASQLISLPGLQMKNLHRLLAILDIFSPVCVVGLGCSEVGVNFWKRLPNDVIYPSIHKTVLLKYSNGATSERKKHILFYISAGEIIKSIK